MYTGEARLAKNIASIYLQNLYSKKDLIKVFVSDIFIYV